MSKEMELYFEKVKKEIVKYNNVVIYGAGRKAIALHDYLKEKNIKIDAFFVSRAEENKSNEHGIKVYGIENNPYDPNETLVLIGVRQRWNQEVINSLEKQGYRFYLQAPEGIEYLGAKDFKRIQKRLLQITTQIGCKIDCKYCPQEKFINRYVATEERERIMTFDLYKKYIDQTQGDVILEFSGFSDCFLNKDCIQMLEYASEKGHEIELFTTLEGLTLDQLEKVSNILFREVVLHIPDKNRNSKIDITDEYMELLKRILELKKKDGSSFVDWASCHGEPADEIKELVTNRIRIITKLHDRAGNLSEEELETKQGIKGKILCTRAVNLDHTVLLPDGSILLCDMDWGMQHILGNLKEETYEEILNGTALKEIKQMMDMEDGDFICRNCCYAVQR